MKSYTHHPSAGILPTQGRLGTLAGELSCSKTSHPTPDITTPLVQHNQNIRVHSCRGSNRHAALRQIFNELGYQSRPTRLVRRAQTAIVIPIEVLVE